MFNLKISAASLCKFLRRSNFTRKKIQFVASQIDSELRGQFICDVSLFREEELIFIDETECDRRDAARKYGYGLRGKPVKYQKLLVRGERISVIVAMTVRGVLDLQIVRGIVNGDIFLRYYSTHLMPYNGENPNSIVLLDNCSVHHVDGVVDTMQDVGAIVHFLPPYSPDMSAIELLFSKLKYTIRSMEAELSATADIETIVLAAFCCITSTDCEAWIMSIGVYEQ